METREVVTCFSVNSHQLDTGPINPTQSTTTRQLVGTTYFESVNLEQLKNTYESKSELDDLLKSIEEYKSELVDLQKPIDMYEPEANQELVGTSKIESTMEGRRYPLRERRAPT